MIWEGYKVETLYFLEHLTYDRINECRQLADEIRRAALAEQAERKGRQASSWFSLLFRLLSRRLAPYLRPFALGVRAGGPRDW